MPTGHLRQNTAVNCIKWPYTLALCIVMETVLIALDIGKRPKPQMLKERVLEKNDLFILKNLEKLTCL